MFSITRISDSIFTHFLRRPLFTEASLALVQRSLREHSPTSHLWRNSVLLHTPPEAYCLREYSLFPCLEDFRRMLPSFTLQAMYRTREGLDMGRVSKVFYSPRVGAASPCWGVPSNPPAHHDAS